MEKFDLNRQCSFVVLHNVNNETIVSKIHKGDKDSLSYIYLQFFPLDHTDNDSRLSQNVYIYTGFTNMGIVFNFTSCVNIGLIFIQ